MKRPDYDNVLKAEYNLNNAGYFVTSHGEVLSHAEGYDPIDGFELARRMKIAHNMIEQYQSALDNMSNMLATEYDRQEKELNQ